MQRCCRSMIVCFLGFGGLTWAVGGVRAQTPSPADSAINAQLLERLKQLEAEVKEVKGLRQQVNQLQGELSTLRDVQQSAPAPGSNGGAGMAGGGGSSGAGGGGSAGGGGGGGSGGGGGEGTGPGQSSAGRGESAASKTGGPEDDNIGLQAHYKYNFGGGYFELSDPDGEYTIKLQNQITADGTFYDRQNIGSSERGFNVPFQRLYLYGNVTKNWEYQLATQGFLGSFNLLDMFINAHFDDRIQFKFGRMLSPFLYEYYGFSPAWEPVITNSPLFQVAGKRQVGGMLWGKVFDNKVQYMAGIYNGINGGFFDLDKNKDFLGSLTVTPFKGDGNDMLDSLGLGMDVETGYQNYMLNEGNNRNFVNGAGEPTTNQSYITSSGVPFFQYNNDVRAWGNRTKLAPHIFWFGRFSVLAEYVIQSRQLANSVTTGTSVLHGYYVNTSYFLTGERYNGDGLGGYTTISPLRPLMPSQGKWGPGAWEIAAQFSEMNVGNGDFARGFADPTISTNRLDQLMVGLNWWPNKWVRVSFDWVYDKFNRQIPINGGNPVDEYNIFWTRMAMFF